LRPKTEVFPNNQNRTSNIAIEVKTEKQLNKKSLAIQVDIISLKGGFLKPIDDILTGFSDAITSSDQSRTNEGI